MISFRAKYVSDAVLNGGKEQDAERKLKQIFFIGGVKKTLCKHAENGHLSQKVDADAQKPDKLKGTLADKQRRTHLTLIQSPTTTTVYIALSKM